MYGKLNDGNLTIAPKHLKTETEHIYNPPTELYLAQGWLPVVFTDEPEAVEGYYWESGWSEENGEIVQTWTMVELPDEVDEAEAWGILFGED